MTRPHLYLRRQEHGVSYRVLFSVLCEVYWLFSFREVTRGLSFSQRQLRHPPRSALQDNFGVV